MAILNDSSKFSRYDLYFLITLLSLIPIMLSLIYLYRKLTAHGINQGNTSNQINRAQVNTLNHPVITTKLPDKLPEDLFATQTLKNFLQMSNHHLNAAITANQQNEQFNFSHQFDCVKIKIESLHKDEFKVDLKIVNNIKAKELKSPTQKTAAAYLNNFTNNSVKKGAKALFIGPNQCGKTHLTRQFAESIQGVSVIININANDFKYSSSQLSLLLNTLFNAIKNNDSISIL